MIIEPKIRGFICTTAHPEGCRENVNQQIAYTKSTGTLQGPKKVLIIGASTGYGLATRIAAAYTFHADTIGIMFEKEETDRRTATPGWYNTKAFEDFAKEDGLYAETINGDAFSKAVKEKAVALIKEKFGKADMVIYSLAAPRRLMEDGTVYQSVLKTTDKAFTNKSWDLRNNTIVERSIPAASEEEINATVKVMGGEDWKEWMKVLDQADAIEDNAVTLAYSYIGPELTYPVYYDGTIGMAKKHLQKTAEEINEEFKSKKIKASISVNKALVTQASSAIPIVPLYFAILYKVMKDKKIHEGCIEQMNRLFHEKLNLASPYEAIDSLIRLDDYEMREDVQAEVMDIWNKIDSSNIKEMADLEGYWEDFYHMFGFHFEQVDYTKDIPLAGME